MHDRRIVTQRELNDHHIRLEPNVTDTQFDAVIYTDGGCSPNPGLGGWAAVLLSPKHPELRKEISGAEPDTTNNRMELRAALEGVQTLKRSSHVKMVTDSQYLKKAFTDGWLVNWQRNGWKTAAKKPVKNEDLWRALIDAMGRHTVEWAWVKGHANNEENNRCDELVQEAREQYRNQLAIKG